MSTSLCVQLFIFSIWQFSLCSAVWDRQLYRHSLQADSGEIVFPSSFGERQHRTEVYNQGIIRVSECYKNLITFILLMLTIDATHHWQSMYMIASDHFQSCIVFNQADVYTYVFYNCSTCRIQQLHALFLQISVRGYSADSHRANSFC